MAANPPSSVRAVRPALFNQLATELASSPNTLVSLGPPGPYEPDDIVAVGNVHRTLAPSHMVGSGGAGWMDEGYQIQVEVSVYRGGDNELLVWNRMCDLVDLIEAGIRADVTIGGLVLWSYPQQVSYETDWEPDHKGRLGSATVAVHFMNIQ